MDVPGCFSSAFATGTAVSIGRAHTLWSQVGTTNHAKLSALQVCCAHAGVTKQREGPHGLFRGLDEGRSQQPG